MLKFKFSLLWTVLVSLIVGSLSGFLAVLLFINYSPFCSANIPLFNFFKPKGEAVDKNIQEQEGASGKAVDSTVEAVKKVAPAVVSIVVTKDISKYVNQTGPFPFDDFFREFGFPFEFKFETPAPAPTQPKSQEPAQPNKQRVGGGSGFIIRSNGLILTNKHVVADPEAEYTVVASDGKQYPAKVLASDALLDIALVKIEAANLPAVKLGNSDNLEIGQTVIAIGYSLGQYQNSVTRGVISGIKRRVVAGDSRGVSEIIEEAIQTDAAINPGNSGGPLLNLRGEVIGINTAINREGEAIGFALPINRAKTIAESVEKYGRIVRPWLGVRYIILDKEISEKNKILTDYGALIVRGQTAAESAVVPGSPADKAGLLENDIILEVNGQKIAEDNSLSVLISKFKVGDEITLKILRKSETKIIKVKLEEMKEAK